MNKKIAYKFRGKDQFSYVKDIITKKRLYCAEWNSFSDKEEGHYFYFENAKYAKDLTEKILNSKEKYKVCSLGKEIDNEYLWECYASNYSGFAIEVEMDASKLQDVQYKPKLPFYDFNKSDIDLNKIVREILLTKTHGFTREDEIRILHSNNFCEVDRIIKIVVGHNVNESILEELKCICNEHKITLYKTKIDGDILCIEPYSIG